MYNPSAFAMENSTDNTTIADKQHNFSPNRMGWVVRQAVEEILGQDGENTKTDLMNFPAHLKYSPSPDDFSLLHITRLQVGLESAYGSRAGRGLTVRIGRACLKYALREFGSELGLTDLEFRLLQLQAKLDTVIDAFADLFSACTDQRVHLERDRKAIYWIVELCPQCRESQVDGPYCYLAVGFLQEALFWASGGKYFDIIEKRCVDKDNDTCTIQIDRSPVN